MTQSQLARVIETSERNIQRWESGQNAPRVEHLVAIAKATGQDTAFFLDDDEPKPDDEEADQLPDLDVALRSYLRRLIREEKTA